MKLEGEIFISKEKLTKYLLQWRPVSDKSRFLGLAGYTLENWEMLLSDIQDQLLTLDCEWQDEDDYGVYYLIEGVLSGPNGKSISVKTIWIKEHFAKVTRFITLFPK